MHRTESAKNPYASPLDWWRSGPKSESTAAIVIEGEDNLKEFLRATFVSLRRIMRWCTLLFSFLALSTAFVVYWKWRRIGEFAWHDIAMVVFALLGPVWIWIGLVIVQRCMWRSSAMAREPFRREITAESIASTTPTLHTVIRWEALRGFREGHDLLLISLAHNANQWLTFSRRHFSPNDWERFRQLVESKLPRI